MGRGFTKAIKNAEMQGVLKQIPPDAAQAMGQTNTLLGNIVKASGVATPVVQPVASLQFDNEERAKRIQDSLGRAAFGPERIKEILMQLKGLSFLADGGRVGYQAGGPATPEQYLSALQKVGAGSAEQKTRSLGDYVLNYATQTGQQLFPEGNFQKIKASSPTQRDYNINASADLVRNNLLGVVGEMYAPVAAAALSLPYDAIQAYTRMKPESGIKGYFDAFMAENPFSSLGERAYGATLPLAERISKAIGQPMETSKPIPTQIQQPSQQLSQQPSQQLSQQLSQQPPTGYEVATPRFFVDTPLGRAYTEDQYRSYLKQQLMSDQDIDYLANLNFGKSLNESANQMIAQKKTNQSSTSDIDSFRQAIYAANQPTDGQSFSNEYLAQILPESTINSLYDQYRLNTKNYQNINDFFGVGPGSQSSSNAFSSIFNKPLGYGLANGGSVNDTIGITSLFTRRI